MSRVEVIVIIDWSGLESYLERIAIFFLFDLDLEVYNKYFSVLVNNAMLSQVW